LKKAGRGKKLEDIIEDSSTSDKNLIANYILGRVAVKDKVSLATLFAVFFCMMFVQVAQAQRQYHLDHEWVKIWINQNGSIDLFYDVSITLDSGPNINYVNIGQPKSDFTIGTAIDQYNNLLTASDASSGSDYKVRVNLYSPLTAGNTARFNLTTNVAHMIYEDNETNVGMKFIPTWWSEAGVLDLRVSIVLPLGVNATMVGTSVNWDNVLTEPDGRLSVFWERQNLMPNEQYGFGVSFPKKYVQYYDIEHVEGQTIAGPTDDTYVQSWSPSSNYGGQGALEASKYEYYGETYQRIIWLKFDLSGVPNGALVDVATLALYANSVPETYTLYACSCADNSWNELTLTYSNMPGFNVTQMDLAVVSRSQEWYNWSVGDAVRKAVDGVQGGPNIVTIVLLETSIRGELSSVSFYSKENSVLYEPRLAIHWSDIISEFQSLLILPLLMITTLLTVIVYRRKHLAR